jgi:hypothetical protein
MVSGECNGDIGELGLGVGGGKGGGVEGGWPWW